MPKNKKSAEAEPEESAAAEATTPEADEGLFKAAEPRKVAKMSERQKSQLSDAERERVELMEIRAEREAQKLADRANTERITLSAPEGLSEVHLCGFGPYRAKDGKIAIPKGFLKEARRFGIH